MNLYVGTSGYSYKEWKGTFYPEDLPEKQMLRFYGVRFRAVEINNTFYRMPSVDMLKAWVAARSQRLIFRAALCSMTLCISRLTTKWRSKWTAKR